MPLTPLTLQASSLGLLVTFRANQTHDRLKEGTRAMAGMHTLAQSMLRS